MADLLIAGCGYLGLRVAEDWLQRGQTVAAVTRSEERARLFETIGIEPIVADLSQPAIEISLPQAASILWSVGFERGTGVSREAIWEQGLRQFLNALSRQPARFLYVSSSSVYGSGDGQRVSESTAVAPVTEGGSACVVAEQLVNEFFGEVTTEALILRLAGIYGPNRLLRRIQDLQNEVPLPGDPDSLLNLIHVDDAVRLVRFMLMHNEIPAVLNGVAPAPASRREYYGTLATLTGSPTPVFDDTQMPRRGGNREVCSEYYDQLKSFFLFPDHLSGLQDAVARSSL